MNNQGYIYVLIRADFIHDRQYIYKIGYTARIVPYQRLWEYPYGSVFLSLIKVAKPKKFETQLINKLKQHPTVIWRSEIGSEYFECDFNVIITIILELYPSFEIKDNNLKLIKYEKPINEKQLSLMNRIHYVVDFNDEYFGKILNNDLYMTNEEFDHEQIYQLYQRFLGWHPQGYHENYVIRKGIVPLGLTKKF